MLNCHAVEYQFISKDLYGSETFVKTKKSLKICVGVIDGSIVLCRCST